MEALLQGICDQGGAAPWLLFLLLLGSGFSLPLSEDLIIVTAGFLSVTCFHHHPLFFFFWIYLGCLASAWEAYWLGRLFGPKLYQMPLLKKMLNPEKVDRLHVYYERFGIWTFILGRFCPGGVRNALFMTSGLGKMPFLLFAFRDLIGCLFSCMTFFMVGRVLALQRSTIADFIKTYDEAVFIVIFFALIAFLFIQFWLRK